MTRRSRCGSTPTPRGTRFASLSAEVAGFDETGFRVDGRLRWVHCARTGKYTLLMVHPKRGRQAMVAMGVLPSFAGVAVHDAWAPYDTFAGPDHQLCCARALRELQAVRCRQDDYLRFTVDFRAPPDYNGSERDIRMVKLRQKVSGCLRTFNGARQFCAIRSYLSTATKHGLGVFDALVMLTKDRPWMPVAA